MWLGFFIHEEIERHRGIPILTDNRSNIDFHNMDTPSREIFPHIPHIKGRIPTSPTKAPPNDKLDAVPSHLLNFTQIQSEEKVTAEIKFCGGFHNTIQFDTGFKGMSRGNAQGACIERLK